jgi:hypothetical protein
MRQAFFKASIDTFLHAEAAELEYLGRLSQGFFAFHGLGVFGDLAKERLNMAAETVWLIDSDTLIRLLALGCYGNSMFMDSIRRLKKLRLRFFTTTSLMQEAKTHLWFAQMVITSKGPGSLDVMESAYGQAPYRKPNLFMEGFINWQAAGNPCNWRDYIYAIFQKHEYADIDYEQTLNRLGIEVVELNVWPGFIENHYGEVQEYSNQIVAKMSSVYLEDSNETDEVLDAYRKAKPEAEAYNIITKERAGVYYINAEKGKKHEAWFLSHTSMLNLLEKNTLITWQPQAFLGYASTLCDSTSADSTKESFERIVLSLAQSGMNLLDNDTIARVFGGVIEQAGLDIQSLRDEYKEILEKKYGESIDSVLARIPPPYFPLAVTQLAAEVAQGEADKRRAVEKTSVSKDIQIEELKRRLRPLEKYQNRMLKNQNKKKKRK